MSHQEITPEAQDKLVRMFSHLIEKEPTVSDQDKAEMAWSDIAASAYRAYSASTGNKNFRGEPMPAFDDLPQPIKTAWEAAVRQASVASVYMEDPSRLKASEQRWAGWMPPHLSPG